MATWDKDEICIQLVTATTASDDESAHTVKFQPIDQAYPTGAVNGVQGTTEKSRYFPASDLDDETHYDVYIDGTAYYRLLAKKSNPGVGG